MKETFIIIGLLVAAFVIYYNLPRKRRARLERRRQEAEEEKKAAEEKKEKQERRLKKLRELPFLLNVQQPDGKPSFYESELADSLTRVGAKVLASERDLSKLPSNPVKSESEPCLYLIGTSWTKEVPDYGTNVYCDWRVIDEDKKTVLVANFNWIRMHHATAMANETVEYITERLCNSDKTAPTT